MSQILKHFLISLIVILGIISSAKGQVGLKIMQVRPTNDFGFIAKKTVAFEALWLQEFEGKSRMRTFVNFANFKSRMDTIPSAAFVSSGNGQEILPAYNGFNKMWNLTLGFGVDFSPEVWEDWKIRPFAGLDFNTGAHSRQSFTNTGVSSIDEGNLALIFGLAGRLGVEANFDRFGLFLEATRNYQYYLEVSGASYNTIGLGVKYFLN